MTFLMVYLFWILLSFSLAIDELLAGAAVSLLVTYFTYEFLFTKTRGRVLNPLRWMNAAVYFAVFIREEIKAHADLAYRIITGRINPGMVTVSADMETDIGRTMIANSITLTPGTLTVRISGKRLQVHCIDMEKGPDSSRVFESRARKVFEDKSRWEDG